MLLIRLLKTQVKTKPTYSRNIVIHNLPWITSPSPRINSRLLFQSTPVPSSVRPATCIVTRCPLSGRVSWPFPSRNTCAKGKTQLTVWQSNCTLPKTIVHYTLICCMMCPRVHFSVQSVQFTDAASIQKNFSISVVQIMCS